MISRKNSKLCGIIDRIRDNFDIKLKKLIYDSFTHTYLTYCINVWSSRYETNLVRSLFATTQQRHSIDIFTVQKCLPLTKLIKLQERTLAYKVNNGQYLQSNFLNDGHIDSH